MPGLVLYFNRWPLTRHVTGLTHLVRQQLVPRSRSMKAVLLIRLVLQQSIVVGFTVMGQSLKTEAVQTYDSGGRRTAMRQKNLADLYHLDPIPWSRALEALETTESTAEQPGPTSWPRRDPTAGRTAPGSAPSGTTARSTS